MSIRKKLIIAFFLMALLPLFLVSLITYNNYKKSLENVRLTQLSDLAAIKSERLEEYFSRLSSEIEMAEYFYNVKKNLPILTKFSGKTSSPEFQAAKNMLDGQLIKMQVALNLSNVLLVDSQGKVVYASDAKSFANYISRPLPGPGLKAFSDAKKGIFFSDVFNNSAKNNDLEILVTAPVEDFNGSFIGAVAFEIDMHAIYNMVQDSTGLGKTGESLIGKVIGNEIVYLNPLKYDSSAALNRRVPLGGSLGGPIQLAAQGGAGSGQLIDYRGKPVIAAWKPIRIIGWGLVSKIDTDEAFEDAVKLRNMMFFIWGVILILGGMAAYYIASTISKPLKKLSVAADIVGRGNLDHKVATDQKDEVGQLSRSFDKMIGDLKGVMASRDELNKEVLERQRAEAKLRTSEERWSTTLSSIGDGVIATDNEGRITFMNAVSENLTGWTMADAMGQPITKVFDIVNEQSREQVINPAAQALQSGNIVSLANHTVLIKKNGTESPIDDSAAPIKDREGKIVGAVLIFRDITERKRAESYREMGREILEILNEPGDLRDSLQQVNSTIRKCTGFDAVGIRLQDKDDFPYFVHEGFSEEFLLSENSLVERKKDGEVCRDKDGNISLECTCGLVISGKFDPDNPLFSRGGSVWTNDSLPILDIPPDEDPRHNPRNQCIHHGYASIAIVPIRNKDKIVGLLHLNDRRKNRLTIETVETLESIASHIGEAMVRKLAEKAKNNFIAVLAHELRNPLAPLLLTLQKLEMIARTNSDKSPKDPINATLLESTDIAFRQIENMTRLLDDLLDVSRIDRGKIHLKIEKVDLSQVIKNSVISAQSIINDRRHTMEMTRPDEPVVLEGDPVRLEQIFVNLLNNAAKYTDRGGHIKIDVARIGNMVEVSVKDNGMGISSDKLQNIFEPFFQTEAALRRSHGGLGLGLMLVKNLIRMHNGSIKAKSQGEGKGSEFIVCLPVLPIGTKLPQSSENSFFHPIRIVPEGVKKILVIDDNKNIAALTRDLLEYFGHQVATAHDGRAGVKMADEIKPDVILCDIGLPGMDGYEVARAIRKKENGDRKILMVAVTGFGQEEDRELSRKAGFDNHLVKPVGVDSLREAIGI